MRYLKLIRIASSILFALLAVLFLVLWIRSYLYVEGGMISTFPNQHIAFHGGSGRMCVWFEHSAASKWFDWNSRPYGKDEKETVPPELRVPIFDLAFFWPTMTRLYVAHWLLFVVFAALAIVPWIPRKFSMRGMLIGITVIALLIFLISWIDANVS